MNLVRDHHKRIMSVLEKLNVEILMANECYFGGGTAIALLLNEYRTSVDIDFHCASRSGFSELRELVFQKGIEGLFVGEAPLVTREPLRDRDGIRTSFEVDGYPIKFEIIAEVRIDLDIEDTVLPVPTLSKECLFAEKLLANDDRGMSKMGMRKDFFDLIMMQNHWGDIPEASLKAAFGAYKTSFAHRYRNVFIDIKKDKPHLLECFKKLEMSESDIDIINNYFADENNADYVLNRLEALKSKNTI